jgi:hypothetical protein
MFLVSLSQLHVWHHRSLKNTSNHTNHWETQHAILITESTLVPQIDISHTIIYYLQISFCNIWNIRNSSYKMRGEFQPVASGSPLWNALCMAVSERNCWIMWNEENVLLISSLCGNVLIETLGCALLISSTIKCNYKDIFVACVREEEMRTQFKCEKIKGRRQ